MNLLNDLLDVTRVAGTVAIGILLWLIYFNIKDRRNPEPKRLVLLSFLLGVLSAGAALFILNILARAGAPIEIAGSTGDIAIVCFIIAGPIEEGVKFAATRFTIFRSKHFDEEMDGLVYASAVALGFSALENFMYIREQDWKTGVARSLASPLSHSLFSAIWGFGLSYSRTHVSNQKQQYLIQASALLLAMAVHGLYDFLLFAFDAPYLGGTVVLVLWIVILFRVRHITPVAASL